MEQNRTIHAIDLTTEFDEFEELCVTSFGSGTNPSRNMYRWLFDEDPYDPPEGNLMFVMRDEENGGRMIASDGLIPFELQLGKRTVKAAHSVKSMTHPDYKRQGIFRIMTQNSLDRGQEKGVQLVLGFANKNSYPAYQKFGWTTIFPREVYVFPSDVSRKIAAKTKSKVLGKLGNLAFRIVSDARRAGLHAGRRFTVQTFDHVPKEAAQLWEKYRDKYENLIVRDETYLHWRYDQRPDRSYETLLLSGEEGPVGYLILRQTAANGKPMVCVAENFTDPDNEEYIGALAETLISYCRRCKTAYAVICSSLYGKYDKVFRRYGFVKQKGQGNIVIVKSLDPSISEEDLTGAEHWHMTQGDGESELDL